jgi:hypothetical protein
MMPNPGCVSSSLALLVTFVGIFDFAVLDARRPFLGDVRSVAGDVHHVSLDESCAPASLDGIFDNNTNGPFDIGLLGDAQTIRGSGKEGGDEHCDDGDVSCFHRWFACITVA